MTTIDDLIDLLNTHPRGQSFLINLHHTIMRSFTDPRWVSASDIKAVCLDFLTTISAGATAGKVFPEVPEMADRLGETFVSKGLWLTAPVPDIDKQIPKKKRILTRVTSYSGFFYSVLGRKKGLPPLSGMPEPIDLVEINAGKTKTVQRTVDSGRWKDFITGAEVRFDAHCIWLAPLAKLQRKLTGRNTPDLHRDIIGLSHFKKGRHLIRLDFDMASWPMVHGSEHRRPHGAGNGGSRFRLNYDGRESACQWGRTVDLSRVATRGRGALNGVPELLMRSFSVPKDAITATYLGRVAAEPECEDDYFLKKLRKKETMPAIVASLKRALA